MNRSVIHQSRSSVFANALQWTERVSSLRSRVQRAYISNELSYRDPISYLNACHVPFSLALHEKLNQSQAYKINVQLECIFALEKRVVNGNGTIDREVVHQTIFLPNHARILSRGENISEFYFQNIAHPMNARFDEFHERESGKALVRIVGLHLALHRFDPMRGSSYMPLPDPIARKQAIINVENRKDSHCFLWSLACAMQHNATGGRIHHCNRPSTYQQTYRRLRRSLDLSGIHFPTPVSDMKRFECQNPDYSINVYQLEYSKGRNEWRTVGPVYYTKCKKEFHFNLILHVTSNNSHYSWIKDLGRLISSQYSREGHRLFPCDRCLHVFRSHDKFSRHEVDCATQKPTHVELPHGDKTTLSFHNFQKQQRHPLAVYVDFEALTTPLTPGDVPASTHTHRYQKHIPYAVGMQIVCEFDPTRSRYIAHRGLDCTQWLLSQLEELAKEYQYFLDHPLPLVLREGQLEEFQNATHCHICGGELLLNRVMDHNHFTGEYRGAAHRGCNVNYRVPKYLPVVMHNGSSYDWHFIVREWANLTSARRFNVIPHTTERFVSISHWVGGVELRFLDSLKFLSFSLDTLSQGLHSDELKFVREHFADDAEFELCRRKGVFPYDHVSSLAVLEETALPPIERFYSRLANKGISTADYAHAHHVWDKFGIQNLGEYADLYLKIDVLLLADVFEAFRLKCSEVYGLDAIHYYTTPGLSFDAMLKTTGIRLDLLTDIEMVLFFERGIRGGLVQLAQRRARANHPFMGEGYDPALRENYLVYWDVNNLYGTAMSQPLPTGDFRWVPEEELANYSTLAALKTLTSEEHCDRGYALEVDLDFPEHIHDRLSDLPPCPERAVPPPTTHAPASRQTKLMATLRPRRRYVVHLENLVQAMELGVELTKVHRVLSFRQSAWLAVYMNLNTEHRKRATTKFERDFFKLMNNAIYGKSMEDVRNYRRMRLVNQWGGRYGARNLIADPAFLGSHHIDGDLMLVELRKTTVKLVKPIYLGFCILELSKKHIVDFHYNYAQKNLHDLHLLYTDTDSLVYSTSTNVYAAMNQHPCFFDTSTFPANNQLGITPRNATELGKYKDECGSDFMVDFAGLRAKMYAFLTVSQRASLRAKGVQKRVVENMRFVDYTDCLGEEEEEEEEEGPLPMRRDRQSHIVSKSHLVYTEETNKISLSVFDDKRYWPNRWQSLPWGHYGIPTVDQAPAAPS